MKKTLIGWLSAIIVFIIFIPTYGLGTVEEESIGIIERLSISLGKESLYYKQREPETATTSSADVINTVLSIRWFEQWECFIDGIKAVIPVSTGDDKEVENSYGKHPYRTNRFSYEWTRIDGYIGYALFEESHYTIPALVYAGLRWSEAEQTRDHFVVLGNPVAGVSKEKIASWGLLIGFSIGSELFPPDYAWRFDVIEPKAHSRWLWYWGVEGNIPLSVKVTDSALPGVSFKRQTGYTIEAKGGVGWVLSKTLSLEANIYAGVISWQGSDWKDTSSGRVKWPENKTDYAGIDLGLTVRF